MAVERSELELVWPPALFAREGRAVLRDPFGEESTLGWLLAEAFHDDRGRRLFIELKVAESAPYAAFQSLAPPYGMPPPRPSVQLVLDLIRDAEDDVLPRYTPKRYYSQRHTAEPEPRLTGGQAMASYADLVARLAASGYLDDAFGSSRAEASDKRIREGQRRLSEIIRLDGVDLWPMTRHLGFDPDPHVEDGWDTDTFYDVVEALHDLVARPRRRDWRKSAKEWDYSDFSRSSGQAVYRWRVNDLLDRSEVPLRLAESGADVGQLVHAAGDPRDDLVDRALATPAVGDRAEVEHAIGLFRRRSSTREDKRGAIFDLGRVLESRRRLIHATFVSGDENALFQIGNTFDLRHREANQRPDYPDAYLDWVFWWYLATVELTDRLLARQAAAGG